MSTMYHCKPANHSLNTPQMCPFFFLRNKRPVIDDFIRHKINNKTNSHEIHKKNTHKILYSSRRINVPLVVDLGDVGLERCLQAV